MPLSIFRLISALLLFLPMAMAMAMEDELPVTPKQAHYLAATQQKAVKASQEAEAKLIEAFNGAQFRSGLLSLKAFWLAMLPATELLAQVKKALGSMEYTTNFDVSPTYRKLHPGQPSMNLSTIDEWGRIPTMWELRALNSSLVAGIPEDQWKILEAAETGLYQMPITESSKLPAGPTQAEAALERPQYIASNIHSRADIGVPRYGVLAALLRNDVVRDRGVMLSSDSGGWENGCNATITPIEPVMEEWAKLTRCEGIHAGGEDRPVLGVAGHELHTLLGNTVMFGMIGGHLSRLVWELLDKTSQVPRMETLFYIETGLLGPVRPQDIKLLVASFATVFSTPDADDLRAFCARHGIPLAWALSSGETWDDEQIQNSTYQEWMPFSKDTAPVGGARVLDRTSWNFTNAAIHPDVFRLDSSAIAIWKEIETEVKGLRNTIKKHSVYDYSTVTASQFKGWFSTLDKAGGHLRPLWGDECPADLCFGTYETSPTTLPWPFKAQRKCLCRGAPTEPATPAPETLIV